MHLASKPPSTTWKLLLCGDLCGTISVRVAESLLTRKGFQKVHIECGDCASNGGDSRILRFGTYWICIQPYSQSPIFVHPRPSPGHPSTSCLLKNMEGKCQACHFPMSDPLPYVFSASASFFYHISLQSSLMLSFSSDFQFFFLCIFTSSFVHLLISISLLISVTFPLNSLILYC